MKSWAFLILLIVSVVLGGEPRFDGRWYVVMKAPAGELPYEIRLKQEGGKFSGELDDGHHRVPLQDFKLEAGKLSFGIDDARVKFEAKLEGERMVGVWRRVSSGGTAELPFTAARTPIPLTDKKGSSNAADFIGEWFCVRRDASGKETPVTIIVRAEGDKIGGTGIDPSGDYGVLSGALAGDRLVLSRFDGQSLSLVVASREGENLSAAVSTSPGSQFTISGARKGAALPDPGSVAKVNNLSFEYPDTAGKRIKFPDAQYKGKVVIVNIMGTWCHNCHDETPLLIELYKRYHDRGLEIVSLCFEATASEAEDKRAIERYRTSRKIPYTMLYAGKVDTSPAQQVTGLENFGGYPTNIFIGRNGQVAVTHTGFWGPATGEKYLNVRKHFEETVEKLISQ